MSRSGPVYNNDCYIIDVVLIPLLVDVPLWVRQLKAVLRALSLVLIPLLVDVPLWVKLISTHSSIIIRLNPSFSGCPALGTKHDGTEELTKMS